MVQVLVVFPARCRCRWLYKQLIMLNRWRSPSLREMALIGRLTRPGQSENWTYVAVVSMIPPLGCFLHLRQYKMERAEAPPLPVPLMTLFEQTL